MRARAPVESERSRSRTAAPAAALAYAGAAVALLAAIETALLLWQPRGPAWVLILFPLVGLVYLVAGLVASLRRPANRVGPLILCGSLAWLAAGLANTVVPPLIAIGAVTSTLGLAVAVHLLHAFPSGRLDGRAARVTVACGYAVALVLQAPVYLFGQGPDGPVPAMQIADRPDIAATGADLRSAAGLLVMGATAVLLARRLRTFPAPQRHALAPLFLYGVLAVVGVPITARIAEEIGEHWMTGMVVAQLLLVAGIPVAFAAVMLRGGFARTGRIEELGAWLSSGAARRPALREALADVLGDRSLELALWSSEHGTFIDFDGRAAAEPGAAPGRGTVEVSLDHGRVGAIGYDATLIADPAAVIAAGRVVAIELDRERLTGELLSSREHLRRSRARIAETADGERRRIARDLHDGLQSQLLALALDADAIATAETASPDVRGAAGELRERLVAAVDALRQLVQGLMPAALVERGLLAATKDLADRLPLEVEIGGDLGPGRLPPEVESSGYLVVAEALANAVKHARATAVAITLDLCADGVTIEVRDDGRGGAALALGSGLRGIADRVEAIGGTLAVTSVAGRGTSIVAELPCAS